MAGKENDESRRNQFEQELGRERYVERIPAKEGMIAGSSSEKKRVAAYCRVSTDSEEQLMSYVTQKQAYEDLINGRQDWELVGIYADEGISGTSMKHRDEFNRLIEDAKAGKIDMVITKSISRFARNVVDCVTIVRMLKDLSPPVAVLFEDMNIDTLSMSGELLLVILAAVAQGESEMKSVSVKWGFRKRFEKGIPKIAPLYGYYKEGRNLIVNEDEAAVVQFIYQMYLDGNSIGHICNVLNNHMQVLSPKGRKWTYSTARGILQNEKYCGDVITQKTICVDMFEHKTVKNKGQLDQFKIPDHHEAIIEKEVWELVQKLLDEKIFSGDLKWEDWLETEDALDQPAEGLTGFSVVKASYGRVHSRKRKEKADE